MKYLLFLTLFLSICGLAQAQEANFSFSALEELRKTHPNYTLDQFLPLLPESFRSNFTLMKQSLSLQSADTVDGVIHPRTILFTPDGKFACTFNDAAASRGSDALECYQYNDETRSFEFRQLQFPSKENGLTSSVISLPNKSVNGKISCTLCHGDDPRPNWEGYPDWPDSFGRFDDMLVNVDKDGNSDFFKGLLKKDGDDFLAFREYAKGQNRYNNLIFGPGKYSPYSDKGSGLGDPMERPNLRYTFAVQGLVANRDARILERLPKYVQYQFLLAVLQCDVSEEEKNRYKEFLKREEWDSGRNKYIEYTRDVPTLLQPYLTPIQWTPFFRGIGPHDDYNDERIPSKFWHLVESSNPESYDYASAFGENSMNTFTANDLLKDMVDSGDSDLKIMLGPSNYVSEYTKSLYSKAKDAIAIAKIIDKNGSPIRVPGNRVEACDGLRERFKFYYESSQLGFKENDDCIKSDFQNTFPAHPLGTFFDEVLEKLKDTFHKDGAQNY